MHPFVRALIAECSREIEPESWRCYFPAAPIVDDIAARLAVPSSHLLITPGSNVALRALCRDYATGAADPHLILQSPNYPAWESEAAASGMAVTRVHRGLDDTEDEREQSRRLIAAARAHTGALVALSEPNGPTGRVMAPEDLDALVQVAHQQSHLLVIDACYQAFHGPWTAQLGRHGGAVVVVQSLSKSHGLAGARVAVVAADPARIESLARGQLEEAVAGPSILLAQAMLSRTLVLGEVWREIAAVRDAAAERFRSSGLRPVPSGGNFLTVDVGSARAATMTVAALSEARYRVRNLSDVPGLEGHLRFTVGDAAATEALLRTWERISLPRGEPAGERV